MGRIIVASALSAIAIHHQVMKQKICTIGELGEVAQVI